MVHFGLHAIMYQVIIETQLACEKLNIIIYIIIVMMITLYNRKQTRSINYINSIYMGIKYQQSLQCTTHVSQSSGFQLDIHQKIKSTPLQQMI